MPPPPPMHHHRSNLPQVHPSNDTIFFRGLHNSLKPDEIREFFMDEYGDCTIAFFKQADNEDKLFIALQFKNPDSARQVINKYDDNLVLGSRVQLSWYKDFRKAKQQGIIPTNNSRRQNFNTRGRNFYPRQYPRGRRSDSRSRGRSNRSRSGSYHSDRSYDSRSARSGPSRSVSPADKTRKRKRRSNSRPSSSRSRSGSPVRKSAVSSRSGSKASRSPHGRPPIDSPPRRRSPPMEARRRDRGGPDNKASELEEAPRSNFVVHRNVDRGHKSDDSDRGGYSEQKDRSRNNGGGLSKFKSSFKEEAEAPRREPKLERRDMDEAIYLDEDMNDSAGEKGTKSKPKTKKSKRKKKDKSPTRSSSKRSLSPDQEDDSRLPPEAQSLLQQKRTEIEKSYKQDCETFATVVNMLISKDASLKEGLRFSLEENLKEIGDRCFNELRQCRQKMLEEYS